MWSPTHFRVTVCRARNLKIKGKSGKNDVYVTIKLGNELYQTSVCERTTQPEWLEQCDFALGGKSSAIKLKVYHRNFVGRDDFLGHVSLDVQEFKVHDRPRARWYALLNKPASKAPEKYRGELELLVSFHVHSMSTSQLTLSRSSAGKTGLKGLTQHVDKMASQFSGGKRRQKSRFSLRSSSQLDRSSNSNAARSRLSFNDSRLKQDGDKESSESHSSDSDDDGDEKMPTGVVSAKKPKNGRLLNSRFLSQSTFEIISSRRSEMSSVTSAISPLREEVDTASVDCGLENSEEEKCDVTATGDSCLAASAHDDVMETANEDDENGVDTKEDASPERQPTHPVSVDTSTPGGAQEDEEKTARQQRYTSSFDEISLSSSVADLPCSPTTPSTDVEVTPGQLRDAIAGDSQYVDERLHGAQAAVVELSSSSSLTSETDQRNHRDTSREVSVGQTSGHVSRELSVTQTPGHVSREVSVGHVSCELLTTSSDVHETTDEVSATTANDSGRQKTSQPITQVVLTACDDEDAINRQQAEEKGTRRKLETSLVRRTRRELMRDEETQTSQSTSVVVERPWSPSHVAVMRDYIDCSREELLQKLIQQRHQLRQQDAHIADLERYIDELLVKVIDLQPLLLSHDTPSPPPARPPGSQPASQPRNSEARTNWASPGRHVTSPFLRPTAPPRSRAGLKKFAVGPLQTLLK